MNKLSSRNGILITFDALRSVAEDDLVVYLGVNTMAPAEVVVQIKSFLEQNQRKIGSICIVGPSFRAATVECVLGCDDLVQMKARLGVESYPCLFGRDGAIADIDATDAGRRPRMLRRILTRIVRARHGVLDVSAAVHYAKPSQKHTDRFIRVGNVLVNSVEAEIIAWGCLPHITDDVAFIYTDTGAINVVAAAMRELLIGFSAAMTFSVDSFGSYKGLETFPGTRDGSIWLISATTSGNLAKRVTEKQGVEVRQILSLFSLGAPDETAVCRLDHDAQHNPEGYQSILSYAPDDCALCRAGSTPLWLTDEQFLVSDIAVTAYLPRRDDLSKETLAVLHSLLGESVFRVIYQPNHHTEQSDIFLDLEPHSKSLLATPPTTVAKLGEWFKRRVQQSLPAAADAIVHLDDHASTALASAVASHVSARGLTPTLIAASHLASHSFTSLPESVVVVAATVASGTSVIDLSRILRSMTSVKSVTYVVLVDRSATEERAKQTQQSVTITEDGHRYDYHSIARLPLPDPSAVTANAWDDESRLLQRILDSCSDEGVRNSLETRLNLLGAAKAKTQRGLRDDLFWPSESGSALALSPGFVFLPSDADEKKVSQADVYGVIRCLLHSLRTKAAAGKEPPLRQHPLHRKVLDVGVFYRFNDSVLQAAILRAATPAELDYSYSDAGNQSANARLLLIRAFKDPAAPSAEFALALAVNRMRLTDDDKRQVLEEVARLPRFLKPVTTAFLDAWRSG